MAIPRKGKSFLLFLFLVSCFPHGFLVFCNPEPVPILQEHDQASSVSDREDIGLDDRQYVLLQKLEDIVRNLNEVVARLESGLSEITKMRNIDDGKKDSDCPMLPVQDRDVVHRKRYVDTKKNKDVVEEDAYEGKSRDGERSRGASITKYSPFWSEKFQFASAVNLDFEATCINVLPYRDYEGLGKYVAVGDEKGRVYVFSRNGDLLIDFDTATGSPITAMVSYMSVYKNESILVTGHQNGAISMHKVWEGSSGEEWSSLFERNVGEFAASGVAEERSAITILEVHHVGRLLYILSADRSGRIKVYRENGTIYGLVKPMSRPLAFLKQRLLFLTETGAGSLDLRSMKIRESECEGLNHSLAKNYVLDGAERSKAYGYTNEGDIIHVLLLGDVVNFKCRVRSKKKLDMEEPLAFQAIKGYLLVVNQEKVSVFNVSSQQYVRVGIPRLLFSADLDKIKSSFLNYQVTNLNLETREVIPLVASDREKIVVLGLGGGLVGIYRSNLPVFKGEFSTMLWTSPVLFFIVFLFVAWHFFAKKKEALTSWGPDDPFSSTSATTGAPLGANSGERSLVDTSSRTPEIMELRSSSMRPPPRRYGSPTRYPTGATSSFRPAPSEHNARPPIDPNYRSGSELKFRGATIESTGYPKRREGLLLNSQVVEDSS